MARSRRKPPTAEELAAAQEAEEFLRLYLAAAPASLQRLRERSAATGGPDDDQLDFGRDSLVPLFEWAMEQFKLRPDDEPKEFVDKGEAGRFYQPLGGEQPMWYGRTALSSPDWWDDDTLALIDGLTYYFAEAVIRAVPGAHWEVGHHPQYKRWWHENQPMILGAGEPFEPLQGMFAVSSGVYRRIRPDPGNPHAAKPATALDLQNWYDAVAA